MAARRGGAALLRVALCAMLCGLVAGKLGSCSIKFEKKMNTDYCTKFGTAQHTTMDIDVRARLTNFASLTPADSET